MEIHFPIEPPDSGDAIQDDKAGLKLNSPQDGRDTMSSPLQEIYTKVVSTLSPTERLQLATLILNGLVQQDLSVDDSDTWTETDQSDLVTFCLQNAATAYPEDKDLVREL